MSNLTRGLSLLLIAFLSCRRSDSAGEPKESASWAVTAWGSQFEVFAEVQPLVAGMVARSHTHVTALRDFSPLRAGTVGLIFRSAGEEPAVFEQRQPTRDGIFSIDVTPPREGKYDLAFRIQSPRGQEEIAAGRVRVGSRAAPGGRLLESNAAADAEPEAISFLKEQQWRTEFATHWAREGSLRESVAGPARVRAAAGGEMALTAPVEAVIAHQPFPFLGQTVSKGMTVFALIPRVAPERSLPELRAQLAVLDAERNAARSRTQRLEELLRVEAISQAEVERARANLAGLEARSSAARRDLETAEAVRTGQSGAPTLFLRAPWSGKVAEVVASPGQSVASGATLGRIVKDRPLWLELSLSSEAAARLTGEALGVVLSRPGAADTVISQKEVRFVSRSPEVDQRTSSVAVLLEIDRGVSELPIGSALEAELLLSRVRRGIVIPVSALVDDSGVAVIYEQLSGESFARREIRVIQRQGSQALVTGIRPGARVVTRGGATIRRASLLSSGAPEGHVH